MSPSQLAGGPSPYVNALVESHLGRIFALWDELSALGASNHRTGLTCCMERMADWIGAREAFWVAIVHVLKDRRDDRGDPLLGWRIRAIEPLHAHYPDPDHDRELVRQTRFLRPPGATNMALAAGVGRFRAYTLQSGELVDLDAFRRTEHYDFYYRRLGVHDRMWVAFPVDADAESVFCFDRFGDQAAFTRDELGLAAFTLRGLKWFHHQLLLGSGVGLCAEPLTDSERRIIPLLLSGASERDMAGLLRLSPGTLHQYATRVYRKFGVRGRVEFVAMWLHGSG